MNATRAALPVPGDYVALTTDNGGEVNGTLVSLDPSTRSASITVSATGRFCQIDGRVAFVTVNAYTRRHRTFSLI